MYTSTRSTATRDVFAIIPGELTPQALERLSQPLPKIRWIVSGSGSLSVPYLDVELSLQACPGKPGRNRITHTLHRKPLAKHMYISPASCHHPSCPIGLVTGETLRLRRRCEQHSDFARLNFFKTRLRQRGFDNQRIQQGIQRALRPRKPLHDYGTKPVKHINLKLTYTSRLNYDFIRKALKRHQGWLDHILPLGGVIRVSTKVQPNIFRLLYGQNWKRGG